MVQQQSSSQSRAVGDYVYTVCTQKNGSEWMLAVGKPHKWTTNNERALIFYFVSEAEECMKRCFAPSEMKNVYVGRIRTGA